MDKLQRVLNETAANLKPVYLIFGEERYILNGFKSKFVNKFVPEESRDFNFSTLEEDENFAASLKNQVNTPPFMAEKRYIVARTGEYFTKKSPEDELLLRLFNNFPDFTVLLLLVNGRVDKRLSVVKSVKKIGEIIEAVPPRFNELDSWIAAQFKKRGKRVDGRGIKLLEQMFNNRLEMLENEIEKICLYKYDQPLINLQEITEIISKDRLLEEKSIFALTDALIVRDRKKALRLLNEMLETGAVPLRIMGTIIWQVRLFLSVKELKEEGKSSQEIARMLKVHHYPVSKCYRQSSNYSGEELEMMLERFLEANLNIVRGVYEARTALEMAILRG